MPAKIYVIRHGETDYNKVPRIQGWLDIPLNDNGHKQARDTAHRLANHHIDAVYSSDLVRAHQTAQPIAHHHRLEVSLTTHLRERDMGIFAGWSWVKDRDDEKSKLWDEFESSRDAGDLHYDKHHGETILQVNDRINRLFEHLHAHHQDQHVVLVTHGRTINRLFEILEVKQSVEGYRAIGNGAIHVLEKHTDKYILVEE